jgi:PhnB protein
VGIKGARPRNRQLVPHFIVADPDAAADFCRRVFGAEVLYRAQMPGGRGVHAQLKIGESVLMLTMGRAARPQSPLSTPQALGGSSGLVELYVDDVDAVVERAVAAGGTVSLPPADAYFGDRYAQIVDRTGQVWGLATFKEEVTPEEVERRMMSFYAGQPAGGTA